MNTIPPHYVKIGHEWFSPSDRRVRALNEPACDENCEICSGEYCNVHFTDPCDCDVIQRHYGNDTAVTKPQPKPAKRLRQSSKNYENNPTREVSDAKSQCDQEAALGTAIQGKAEGMEGIVVRFIGLRVRPLDPDNFAASCKDLLDGLRHARLLYGDEPWRIRLETEQVKVKTFKEEMTVIEISGEFV